jgi:hypothetical protein
MLNECQLMAAFRLDWLMVTFGLSVPEMMVVPPTIHQPSARGMLLNSSLGAPRSGVQSMVTAAFDGVLVRSPLAANAFAAAMARLCWLAQHLLHRLDTGR